MEPVLHGPEARAARAFADHLLEEILVCIGAPTDLARASTACKAFRRLITDTAFLRRYRALHPPMLLGCIEKLYPADILHPEGPPRNAPDVLPPRPGAHRNAPVAGAFASAADFSFDHIPRSGRADWAPRDARVVLMCSDLDGGVVSPELAVFDPLTREYAMLPPIPDDLLDSVRVQVQGEYACFFNAFFDPSWGNEDAQFRVLCWMDCFFMAAVFVYSSVSGSWSHGTSIFYAALGLNVQPEDHPIMCQHYSYAYGCLYWDAGISNKMIKLDINSMESTTVSLPADHEDRSILFVEAGEGRIGMFSIVHENPQPLRYSIRPNESENADESSVETTIPLPCEYDMYNFDPVASAAHGYIFLLGHRKGLTPAFFSLEIKTMKVERVCMSNLEADYKIPYFGFPPFMSPRRIRNGSSRVQDCGLYRTMPLMWSSVWTMVMRFHVALILDFSGCPV
ncbi:hypothetical protein EJB05_21414, partial [Eragrostis curvula]